MTNDIADHYIAATDPPAHVAPRIVRHALVQFSFADDVPAAVRTWEQRGFVRIGASGPGDARQDFPQRAAAMGASLIVQSAAPAPPHAVYLAAVSRDSRDTAPMERGGGRSTIEASDKPAPVPGRVGPMAYKAARIQLGMVDDLDAAVARWKRAGFVTLGWADAGGKNDVMTGYPDPMARLAAGVGAALVLYRITPARQRAVRRLPDGRIDMDAVRADAPARMSPGGYSVTQAVFLAPTTSAAWQAADASNDLQNQYVPLAPDE
ncbi:hypothetical protein [Massilia sp. TN1-12]|uniref:hypothetical protein n=1 Tax=Massilia paldalensis TaxID=3377675 RepID=UPI00384D60D7